jgi:restriction system protein
MPARDALAAVQARIPLTDYEKGRYASSGAIRFEKIVRFSTVDAVKANWLLKHKGVWTVTDKGKQAFRDYREPEPFYREAIRLYNEWRKLQPSATPTEAEDETPEGTSSEKDATITFEAAEEQAWAEIGLYLREMPPYDFQDLVADLLKAMGYHIAWKSPPGKDGGLDIVAYNDPLGTRLPRIKVQVKRHNTKKIDVDGLRSFMAVLGENDVGLFVSTSGFTRDAEDEARKQESRKITLIDMDRFFDLWVEHSSKLDDAARRRFPLQPIYFLAPSS